MKIALTIAGSDPSGGAGLQADLKVFQQYGVFGQAVVSLLTVQNTVTVSAVEVVKPELVEQQLRAVLEDCPPNVIKTGALGSSEVVSAIAGCLRDSKIPLVVDPVMISKHGKRLLDDSAIATIKNELFPLAFLITPNTEEAQIISGQEIKTLEDMKSASQLISKLGVKNVLIKGGHLEGPAIDVLFSENEFSIFETERVPGKPRHGTGCVLSSAITANLALEKSLLESVALAKEFISAGIKNSPEIGKGYPPVGF